MSRGTAYRLAPPPPEPAAAAIDNAVAHALGALPRGLPFARKRFTAVSLQAGAPLPDG
jgi:hypothetical protein